MFEEFIILIEILKSDAIQNLLTICLLYFNFVFFKQNRKLSSSSPFLKIEEFDNQKASLTSANYGPGHAVNIDVYARTKETIRLGKKLETKFDKKAVYTGENFIPYTDKSEESEFFSQKENFNLKKDSEITIVYENMTGERFISKWLIEIELVQGQPRERIELIKHDNSKIKVYFKEKKLLYLHKK